MPDPPDRASAFLARFKIVAARVENIRVTRMLAAGVAVIAALTALAFSPLALHHKTSATQRAAPQTPSQTPTLQTSPTESETQEPTPPATTTAAPVIVAPPVTTVTPELREPVYAVGVTHISVTDTSRTTAPRGDEPELPTRTLAVTIRFPIAGATGDSEESDAPAKSGTFPLVVFAHGYNTSAETYADLEHDLAAAGFIVAAPDFPLTSSALPGDPDESDLVNQASDISFVITSLLASAPQGLAGHLAATKVGVVGHSDGGVTAAAAAFNTSVFDSRIGAAAILSGAESDYPDGWFPPGSPPLLAIHGTADEINPFSASQRLYDDAASPKYLVSVHGGSHIGPFTYDSIRPTISALIADFLAANLLHDAAADTRIAQDAHAGSLSFISE